MKPSYSISLLLAAAQVLPMTVQAETFENLPVGATTYVNPSTVDGDSFFNIVSTENGGAVRVETGNSSTVSDSCFKNVYSEKLGGAIYVEDDAELTLRGNVQFVDNAQEAVEDYGVYTGIANDVYLGKDAKMTIDNESGTRVSLGSGVASADASAAIVKKGKGAASIGVSADNSSYAGSLTVEAGSLDIAADFSLSSFTVNAAASATISGAAVGVGSDGENSVCVQDAGSRAFLCGVTLTETSIGAAADSAAAVVYGANVVVDTASTATIRNLSLQNSTLYVDSAASISGLSVDGSSSIQVADSQVTLSGKNAVAASSLSSNQLSGVTLMDGADIALSMGAELWASLGGSRPSYTITLTGVNLDSNAQVTFSGAAISNSAFVTEIVGYETSADGMSVTMTTTRSDDAVKLFWLNAKKTVWKKGAEGWADGCGIQTHYLDGDDVSLGNGTVTIEGEVAPGSLTLNPDKTLTFKTKYDKKTGVWSGAIKGETEVTIAAGPKGKVTMNDGNTYTGTTTIKSGTVNVGGATSFGESSVTISGGTLDLKGKAVANAITLAGEAAIKGGAKYEGEFTMTDGELLKGSVLNIKEKATLAGGEVGGTLSGIGTVYVTGDVELESTAKLTTNGLNISGKLEVGSKGLAMNAKSSAITIAGGMLESEGKLSAYSLTMQGGKLEMVNAKPMAVTLNGLADLSAKANVNLYGAFTAADLDMDDSTFTLAMAEEDITTKNQPKPQKLTLKDKNATSELSNGSTLDIMGSMTVAGGLKLSDSTLSLHDWDEAQKPKAQTLTVKGALAIADAAKDDATELYLTGKLTAGSMNLTNADITLENELAAQSITLNLVKGADKQPVTNTFTGSTLDINGSMTVAGSLAMNGSSLTLEDAAAKPKALGLTVKGALAIADAAKDDATELYLTGKLTAGSMNLTNADITLENELAAQSITLTLAKDADKQPVTNTFTTSTLDINGSMTVAGSLAMNGSSLTLEDAAAKPKALGLTVKGALDIADAAKDDATELYLTGKLTAGSMNLTNADITLENALAAQSISLTLAKDAAKQPVTNTFTGSTLDINGSMTVAGSLALNGSSLTLEDAAAKPKALGLTVKGALDIADAAKDDATELYLTGKLTAGSMNLTNADITLENALAAQSITLNLAKDADKQPVTNTFTGSTLDINGNMTVAGSLAMNGSSLTLEDAAAKPKALGLTVKGALDISDETQDEATELYLTGKLTAGSMNLSNAYIKLENEQAAQSIALTMAKDSQKNPITNTLTDSRIYANGSMSVTGHLSLLGASSIHLEDPAKGKAMNLAVKGDLTLDSGSSLTLSGALSAANMTLNGGVINLTSTKLQTIKVSQTLSFNGNIDLGLQEGLDIKVNKGYNLITFKTLEGVTESTNLYNLLGLADEYCTLTLDLKKKAITLMVTEEEWNQWVTDHTTKTELEPEEAPIEAVAATAAEAEPGITTAAAVEEELPEEDEAEATVVTTTLPVQQAADVEALIAKVSDTLVQTTWGSAKASRAFVDSIGNRGQNATAMADGRGAAWGGVIGATSRLSSHGGSLGADHTLSGAVFGAEMNATDAHSIGLAMGVTWGEINTLSAYNVDQDSTHLAAYGQSRLGKSLTLDWSAAYGRSENDADILGSSYDWTQHALQLDARLSYAYALNERTTLRGFGGMQYLHIDSDTPEKGLKADSMQNVRVEVGVGATYMATAKTAVYGEVSFIGDIVRDNPATHIGGTCRGGSNPGRAGMNMTVGATHALNENWSLNASYNLELQPRANAHNATIGATYRF